MAVIILTRNRNSTTSFAMRWLLRRYGVKTIRFSNQKVSRMAGDERLIAELRNALPS